MTRQSTDREESHFATVSDFNAVARKLMEISHGVNHRLGTVDELSARMTGIEQELVKRTGGGGGYRSSGKSLGAAVTSHAEFATIAGLASVRGKHTIKVNAMITTLGDSGGALIPADKRPELAVMMARQRLTIRDLLMPGNTSSNAIEYPNQTVRSLAAAVVSEGGQKPESNVAFELKTANVRTIAHWTKASLQSLSDAPLLQGILDSELRYGLKLAEEQELLFGDGTGVHLFGIVPQATAYDITDNNSVPNEQRLDTLKLALKQSELALLPATGIVLNDGDLQDLQLLKDSTGQYLGGGPFGPGIREIWGLPTVGTPAMPVGRFLVGAFRDGAQIFDREEMNVMVATENEDDFTHNLCTIRCEERLALAVKRPGAFRYGIFPLST